MSQRFWSLPIVGGILVLVAVYKWQRGDTPLALLTIAIIPLFFVCWGLSYLLAGRKRREIARNLTDEERAQLEHMSGRFGLKMGFMFALPLSIASAIAHAYYGPIGCGIVFIVGLAATMPFAYRMAKPVRQFLWNTQYARTHFSNSRDEHAAL
jgi:hypothetical protein